MSVSNGIISAPVSIPDAYDALGITHAIGTQYDLATAFRSPNINKWARYKPVISADTSVRSKAQYEQMAAGVTVNWGFDRTSMISGVSISDLVNQAAANGADWKYNRPTSGVCRLGDFDGYDHNAKPPCSLSLPSGTILSGTQVSLSLNAAAQEGGLGIEDFKQAFGGDTVYNSLRWAVARISDRNAVSESVQMSLGLYVKDSASYTWRYTFVTGTYELLVFMTNAPTPNAAGGAYYYILVPGGYTSLKVVSAMLQFSVSNLTFGSSGTSATITSVSLDFQVTNNADESVIVGLILMIKPVSSGVPGNPTPNVSVSVGAGGTVRRTVTVTVSIMVVNSYEGCCGYRDEAGQYHWYTLGGSEADSMSDAWTNLGLV